MHLCPVFHKIFLIFLKGVSVYIPCFVFVVICETWNSSKFVCVSNLTINNENNAWFINWDTFTLVYFHKYVRSTGKSLSEALILASTNPQYNNRLFIELKVQYMKIPSSEHVVYKNCFLFLFEIQNNLCTQHVLRLEFSCTELIIL